MVGHTANLSAKSYAGVDDLAPLVEFARQAVQARWPLDATWHPGNVIWNLNGKYDSAQAINVWRLGDEVVAAAWFDGPDELFLESLPEAEHLVPEAVAWAEEQIRHAQTQSRLSIRAFERDRERISTLETLGYRRSNPDSVILRRDLAAALPSIPLPEGAIAMDCADVDVEARAACHRNAWSDLTHIGIENARSSFSAERYSELRRATFYDPTLDVVISAPTGEMASNCICWLAGTDVGLFEPVGTSASFRGRGYGRAAVTEGLKRLKERGAAFARVGTAHFNAPAIATYLSSGFVLSDRTHWWSKDL